MDYLAFLDTEHEAMTLKKSFSYRLGKNRKFLYCIKSYPIQELLVDPEGRMICDFTEECNKIELQIKEEKLQYQRMQEKLSELKEEKRRLDEKEAQHLEAYRRAREQEEKDCLDGRKTIEQSELLGLNPAILEKCKKMIEEGNAHLVSKKYYEAIMKHQ
jgi:hypothetical protein